MTKTEYEKIRKIVENWPQWKKDFCNETLILAPKCKKIQRQYERL